jgi:hypothetical protein
MLTNIKELLNPYGNVLSKPQFSHFVGFVQGLSACEIPSLSRMSEIHCKSRSSMDRFLTESPWEISSLKTIYHNQIKSLVENNSSLLIDDSISHRPYARKVEKANFHYDHTTGKDSLGYSIVTSVISSNEEIIPYDLIPYYRKEDCDGKSFKTKNTFAVEIIDSTKNNPNITEVIFDTWYSNEQVIGACKKAKKHYITQIKSNRNVTINQHKNAVRTFVKGIGEEEWEFTLHKNSTFRFFATSAFISKIGSVHLIFCQKYHDKEKKWGDTHYLISDQLTTVSNILIQRYLNRVGIEGFHRDAKQNLGLEGYFLRKNRGIERYLFLVLLTYGLLVLQKHKTNVNFSIGELCEEQKTNVYKQTFEDIKRNPEIEKEKFKGLARARV